jgi:hypothetical protein
MPHMTILRDITRAQEFVITRNGWWITQIFVANHLHLPDCRGIKISVPSFIFVSVLCHFFDEFDSGFMNMRIKNFQVFTLYSEENPYPWRIKSQFPCSSDEFEVNYTVSLKNSKSITFLWRIRSKLDCSSEELQVN